MKAQFLAEFLTELPPIIEERTIWFFIVDDSSNKKGSGAGIILEGPGQVVVGQFNSVRFRDIK